MTVIINQFTKKLACSCLNLCTFLKYNFVSLPHAETEIFNKNQTMAKWAHMYSKVTFLWECHVTLTTLVWLLPTVCSCMLSKVTLIWEVFVTLTALVWFLFNTVWFYLPCSLCHNSVFIKYLGFYKR